MPVFAIHCIDKPLQRDLRAATRADHLAYLESVIDQVVLAGPLLERLSNDQFRRWTRAIVLAVGALSLLQGLWLLVTR